MTDKTKELNASVKLVNNKLHFRGMVDGNHPVDIDYIAPLGDDEGYTSLELLLLSLASCVGSAVLTFLRRMEKNISACRIDASGKRRPEHPTGFERIELNLVIHSNNISSSDMDKVILLTEGKYCPVYSMIRGNTDVRITYQIIEMEVIG
jgi:putative redox protein